ncbi:polysaccharide pyruvyl transferase family protein, partial [bacterium]|nr:polysaccharide pyruvyl transferase family protein [bacterium]
EYMADELKGIIGLCDMFIGCRMHSTIASTSMSVSTIAVVYGHKSHGVIGNMMGQGKYFIEIEKYTPNELLSELKAKIDHAWANRDSISNELKELAEAAKERALLNGSLIKGLLEKGSP